MSNIRSDWGLEDGAHCHRGTCGGFIELTPVENCSCHINPPCNACLDTYFVCSECCYSERDEGYDDRLEVELEDKPLKGELYLKDDYKEVKKKDFTGIVFSSTTRHKFNVVEGDKVLLRELRCEVTGIDHASGKILVEHDYWGQRWVKEDDVIILKDLYCVGFIKQIARVVFSSELPKLLGITKTDKEVKDMIKGRDEKEVRLLDDSVEK